MIEPEIVSFSIRSEDYGKELDDFTIDIQVDIGPKDGEGSETFSLTVCSPKRLEKILKERPNEVEIGRGLLIMIDFNVDIIEYTIDKIIENCKRPTWGAVSQALSSYFYGEYDI
ncbi:Imm8 family immunity protein [Bacillus safensis]|uniref:Imm8 family immunity protein n=1 Tax=Bacillus safensis TaxID=561879 RepID=UPI000DAD79B5|nr:Imm8 family immunity protein [Bacillus safensis]